MKRETRSNKTSTNGVSFRQFNGGLGTSGAGSNSTKPNHGPSVLKTTSGGKKSKIRGADMTEVRLFPLLANLALGLVSVSI